MPKSFKQLFYGCDIFKKKYVTGENNLMRSLSEEGQHPTTMLVGCCDSRVDPELILQCDPGDLFIVRNVANLIPPYEKDQHNHGTSAALEYGICYLNVQHLIILGHSQCGGIQALNNPSNLQQNDFIGNWVKVNKVNVEAATNNEELGQHSLYQSYENCLTFPWIAERVKQNRLAIHLWYFDIARGQVLAYSFKDKKFHDLTENLLTET